MEAFFSVAEPFGAIARLISSWLARQKFVAFWRRNQRHQATFSSQGNPRGISDGRWYHRFSVIHKWVCLLVCWGPPRNGSVPLVSF